MKEESVKILFQFHSDIFDEEMFETMWATIVDSNKGLYKLDNIPFFAPLIASNDIVYATFDEQQQMLTYIKTEVFSGNSTIQVMLMDNSVDINSIRKIFEELGCVSEKGNDRYFSMEIPVSLDYKLIKQKLDELEQNETIGYAEPCLSDQHKMNLY